MRTWRVKLNGAEFKVLKLHDSPDDNRTTDSPEAIERYIRPLLAESIRYTPDVENAIVVLLNSRRRPIGFEVMSVGTLDTIQVHAREVFRHAIVMNASAIILVHNHPSGDPTPSEADIKVTRDLIRAGQLLKIDMLDHVILGTATPERTKSYSSLRELGYFYT